MSGFAMTKRMTGTDRIGIDRLSTGTGKFAMKVGCRPFIIGLSPPVIHL